MEKPALLLVFFTLFLPDPCLPGDLYRWVDEEGIVHMTDTLSQVPPPYRDQAAKRRTTGDVKSAIPQASTGKPGAAAPGNLKHFVVPYQAFEGTDRRIIIPVTFNESVTARLLLDTGSPGLMISPELADRLGLVNEQNGGLKIITGGIGGTVPATLVVVDNLRVGEAVSEFVPAIITKIPSDVFEGLVGLDFLANYRISIDTSNNNVSFYELPPQLDKPGGHDEAWWRSNFQKVSKLRSELIAYLDNLGKEANSISSEKERRLKIARDQCEEADKLYRKLERYARDNSVPIDWRH
jgi:hypothetical protein